MLAEWALVSVNRTHSEQRIAYAIGMKDSETLVRVLLRFSEY
jgi:hypothetical protein